MRALEVAGHLVGRRSCLGCGRHGPLLCGRCAGGVLTEAPVQDLPGMATDGAIRVLVAYDYSGPARQLVLELKLGGRVEAAATLGKALHDAVLQSGTRGQLVTWVPGRPRDRARRGFDHAHVIAEHLAFRLGLPLQATLSGASERADQAGLGARARALNAAGAFSVRPGVELSGAKILLVDDLLTTGATARACVRALFQAGAGGVEVAVACRAPDPSKAAVGGTRHT